MSDIKNREFTTGGFFLAIGLGYLYMASALPRKQFIDAAFVPYVLAIIMCLLGVMQLWAAKKMVVGKQAEEGEKADYRTVSKTLGLIVAYAAFLQPVGFPIMTIVYLFAQFIVLTPADKKVNYPMYGTIAIITSITVYVLFRYAFDMILPVGLLNGLID